MDFSVAVRLKQRSPQTMYALFSFVIVYFVFSLSFNLYFKFDARSLNGRETFFFYSMNILT